MSRRLDERFANDIRAALEQRSVASAWPILLMIAALIGLFFAWARFAVLDEVARGDGRVIASRQTQVVQSLDGGVVAEIHVEEGQIVQKGEPLFLIDDTAAQSEFGEIDQRLRSLRARRARLAAEAEGRPFAPSDAESARASAETLAEERALHAARADSLARELAVVAEQIAQRRLEKIETEVRLETTAKAIATFERELAMARRLQRDGAFPALEFLKLERQAQLEHRERAVLEAALPKVDAAIAEAEARRAATLSAFKAEAQAGLAETVAEIRVLEEKLGRLGQKVRRTVLRAPTHGVVNTLPVTTIGAVVRPAETVAELVPLDDKLLIEARINPTDIAFLHPGQRARVKVTAYDYTVYGDLPGELIRLGADSLTDEEGRVFYRAVVETEKTHLGEAAGDLPIFPGMVVSVDILTGEKSVLDYLLTPVKRAQSEALRER